MGESSGPGGGQNQDEVAVSVITPSGIFPGEETLLRQPAEAAVKVALGLAATALKIPDTKDWVVRIGERHIDPQESYKKLGLRCLIDIEYHPKEGGGGA